MIITVLRVRTNSGGERVAYTTAPPKTLFLYGSSAATSTKKREKNGKNGLGFLARPQKTGKKRKNFFLTKNEKNTETKTKRPF